jgi:hypothetical protein
VRGGGAAFVVALPSHPCKHTLMASEAETRTTSSSGRSLHSSSVQQTPAIPPPRTT